MKDSSTNEDTDEHSDEHDSVGRDEADARRALAVFSQNGELEEIERAREAIDRSLPSVGVKTDECVVLVSKTEDDRSSLLEEDSMASVFMVSDRVAMASSGRLADAQFLASRLTDVAMEDVDRYGEVKDVNVLAREISENVRETTKSIAYRPYGVALLIGGINEDGSASLYKVELDGATSSWKAAAVGSNENDNLLFMEERYPEVETVDDAVELAMKTLGRDGHVDGSNLSVAVVSGNGFRRLSRERLNEFADDANTGDSQ